MFITRSRLYIYIYKVTVFEYIKYQSKTVMGIDPSITGSGVCVVRGKEVLAMCVIVPKKHKNSPDFITEYTYEHVPNCDGDATQTEVAKTENIRRITSIIGDLMHAYRPDVVAIESVAMHGPGRIDLLSGLNYAIRIKAIEYMGTSQTIVPLPPTVVKKFATKKGNADKILMVDAFLQNVGISIDTKYHNLPDVADAYWIAHAGINYLNNGRQRI